MKNKIVLICILLIPILFNCSRKKHYDKGFSVGPETESSYEDEKDGINKDSLKLETRPSSVLLTGFPEFRLTTVYKVNYDKNRKNSYIGYNYYYQNYNELGYSNGNQWHYNFMPGLQAVYGYNLVNVSHYNIETQVRKYFFASPVLIKTLYFPSFTNDTLNYQPVSRKYYMISVYDEDSNNDGFINLKDLRRFYYFDLNTQNKKPIVPENYSVMSSEYDPANDYMYVFAQLDENKNGQSDEDEDIHVFWVDLKNPLNNGRQY